MTTHATREPAPATLTADPLLVGRNSRGDWIVRDRDSRRGGMFVSRTDALRYVRLETGHRRPTVTMVPGLLELDLKPAR